MRVITCDRRGCVESKPDVESPGPAWTDGWLRIGINTGPGIATAWKDFCCKTCVAKFFLDGQ